MIGDRMTGWIPDVQRHMHAARRTDAEIGMEEVQSVAINAYRDFQLGRGVIRKLPDPHAGMK
jgi:hypothetical protein